MKAIIKETAGFGAKVVDIDIPKVGPQDVLVKVKAASICGTDIHIYRWDPWAAGRVKPPLVFGHELSGEVVDVGAHVEHIKVGDHVSAETHIPCGGCKQCRTGKMHICQNVRIIGVDRSGAFAEHISIPKICCMKNDKSLPWEIASIQEPLGNAVYAVSESNVCGKKVVVFGDGPLGIFAAAVCRVYGCAELFVVGMQRYRLDMMKKFSPDHIIDANKTDPVKFILDETSNEGVDAVIEMSGSETAIHQGLKILSRGGIFTAFGIPSGPIRLDLAEEVIFKGIVIKAINGRKMFETWIDMSNLLNSGRLDVSSVITHTFALTDIDKAMELLIGDEVKAGKIVLKPYV